MEKLKQYFETKELTQEQKDMVIGMKEGSVDYHHFTDSTYSYVVHRFNEEMDKRLWDIYEKFGVFLERPDRMFNVFDEEVIEKMTEKEFNILIEELECKKALAVFPEPIEIKERW